MLVLVCSAIFSFSNQVGSESSQISSNLVIRKLGHFSEYLTLGFFSFAYFSNLFLKNNKCKNFKKTALVSLIFSILYAVSDEFLEEAFRVGRKKIIIKAHFKDDTFEKYNFTRIVRKNTKFHYGFINITEKTKN